ncbi:hypothetical protein XENOCAPTIV_030616 [Xenoophorus captivus]|uniref:Secreted protein n=2 Tax=Goodeidae TaxID=28758 RepID=A0ABV0R616_9TELE
MMLPPRFAVFVVFHIAFAHWRVFTTNYAAEKFSVHTLLILKVLTEAAAIIHLHFSVSLSREEAEERQRRSRHDGWGRPTRASRLIRSKCLCRLTDRPPDLTFAKVCRGHWWGAEGGSACHHR